jgi:two-component system, NarL family, sensor histidine kinase DesK
MTALFGTDERGLSGTQRLVWSGVWLAFLGYPIGDIVSRHHSAEWVVAAWASLAIFVGLYLRTMWLALGTDVFQPRSRPDGWLSALILFTFAVVLAFGAAWGGMIIYLGVATGCSLTSRAAMVTLGVIAAATVAIGVVIGVDAPSLAFDVFLTTALGVTMLGVRRMLQLNVELRDAQHEVARLTAAEQRTRFARDLHDVLGHNLSVIALKSQVARRTMGSDPEAAVAAMSDVEEVARQSLSDVRDLVSGYRQRSLRDELAVADELLTAAGISTTIERPVDLPGEPADALLAWAVREGTTNVIRHSRATHCRIAIAVAEGDARLEITDDGTAISGSGNGSGLLGLRERLAEAGGQVDAGPRPGGGFRLAVQVPR